MAPERNAEHNGAKTTRRQFLREAGFSALSVGVITTGFARPDVQLAGEDRASRRRKSGRLRVLILGFDGIEPKLAERWMAEGKLPNLAKLARAGSYCKLATTNPAESPVAWASFSTGLNPGKTGIMDFLLRVPGTYNIELAMVGRATQELLSSRAARFGICGLLALLVGGGSFAALKLAKASPAVKWLSSVILGGSTYTASSLTMFNWVPSSFPRAYNRRRGSPFWELLGRAGIPCTVIAAPVSFPPVDCPNVKLLTGLCTPDIRGTQGTYTLYSTAFSAAKDTEMGGKLIPVKLTNGWVRTYLDGPRDFTSPERPPIRIELKLTVDSSRRRVGLSWQGKSLTLLEGQWSDWVNFDFAINPLLSVRGMGRFYLAQAGKELQLYLSPINVHPADQPFLFSISSPRSFAAEVVREVGLYKTLGWGADTMGYNEGALDEKAFLEDAYYTMDRRKDIAYHELAKGDWDCFFVLFESTDRIQHVMWWANDPEHPAYDAERAPTCRDAVLKAYQYMDETVGEVNRRFVDEHTLLLVLSDHGFHSWKRGVNLNTWLVQGGYMGQRRSGKPRNLEDLFIRQRYFWSDVDWSLSQAYSAGLAGIYLNQRGREPQGTVAPGSESEAVRGKIMNELSRLTDPITGTRVVRGIYRSEDIFSGPYTNLAPDIIVGFEDGYRTDWQCTLGGTGPSVLQDNRSKWSADHCSFDPSITPGVLFCNRKLATSSPSIMDLAPTVLKLLGVKVPADTDGRAMSLVV